MDLRKFSERNKKRCESPEGFNHAIGHWSLSDWTTATAGELGEAANIVKKLNRIRDGVTKANAEHESYEYLHEALAKELADVFIYLDLWAQAADIDLSVAVEEKFQETNRKIGYIE